MRNMCSAMLAMMMCVRILLIPLFCTKQHPIDQNVCQFSGTGPGEYEEYCWGALYWHGDGFLWPF